MIGLLERKALVREAVRTEEGLPARALRLVSYDRLQNEFGTVEGGTESVIEVLNDLDIVPFSPESVRRYKRRKVIRALLPAKVARFTLGLIAFSIAIFIAGVILLKVCGLAALSTTDAVLLPIFAIFVGAIFGGIAETVKLVSEARWDTVAMSQATDPVPEFALETACRIKERLPSADFEVEEFTVQHRVVDPFLVLVVGSTRYHIEVWQEKGFMQKRKI